MKKLLTFLLVASMIVAMFVVPAAAADDTVNYEEEFDFLEKAPNINGKVEKGEYGVLPVNSYPEDKEQFVDNEGHSARADEISFDFYAGWDADNLYMAWVVTGPYGGVPEIDHNNDGTAWNDADTGYMWQYSCIQFIFTPGVPESGKTAYQTSDYGGDYLEVGLALTAEGNSAKIAWCKPTAAQALDPNEWTSNIVRDGDTITYEVAIPWGKSGLSEVGNGAKFGLTYAVAAQEDYNVASGMIEWQNGVLGGKKADNAAVITLTGNEEIEKSEISHEPALQDGALPSDAKDAVLLAIDGVNIGITGEMAYIYNDPSAISGNNNNWATSILLAPVEGEDGYYTVVETKTGSGEAYSFDSEIADGMIAYIAHSDGEGAGADRSAATKALVVGDKVGLFGVDLEAGALTYKNATLYVVPAETGDESSEVVDESSEAVSEEESSEAVSEEESTATSTTTSESTDTTDEESSSAWIWIVIAVVAVVVVVVVVIVIKKKKA